MPRYAIRKIYKNSWGQKLRFYDFSNCVSSYWCYAGACTDPCAKKIKKCPVGELFNFGWGVWAKRELLSDVSNMLIFIELIYILSFR